jgi:hypothetical protein
MVFSKGHIFIIYHIDGDVNRILLATGRFDRITPRLPWRMPEEREKKAAFLLTKPFLHTIMEKGANGARGIGNF